MSYLITIVAFIVIFSILILVHEFGHFIMAKKAGIKVEEFGFGLPPRLWGKKKGETIYSINWIPFGGFVRMYGEDESDPKSLRSSRSFAAKPMRARVAVVVAGVVMNFLLAWALMSIGFSVGMKPLLGPDDVLTAIKSGEIILEEGVKVKTVEAGGLAEQYGFMPGDLIYSINGESLGSGNLAAMAKDPIGQYNVVRNGELYTLEILPEIVKNSETPRNLGLSFYDFAAFPRVKIYDLKPNTVAYKAGLRSGDVIISVNGQQVFNIQKAEESSTNGVKSYEELARGVPVLEYSIYRNGLIEPFIVERSQARQVIVSEIVPGSPAEKAGIKPEDIILAINGKNVSDSMEVINFVKEHQSEKLAYMIQRGSQKLFYEIKPEDGRIGVLLSELMSYADDQGISLYNTDVFSTIKEVKDQKYPPHIAVYKAFGETYRLSKETAKMFGGFVSNLIRKGDVPESVSGPVGIAQMTHVFVQEGFIPLLRFVAILSLSLAVINILPFPALDGGRLLFIIIEFIFGRRVNQKWENWIHMLGYFLILLLILAVTYSDIVRLIKG